MVRAHPGANLMKYFPSFLSIMFSILPTAIFICLLAQLFRALPTVFGFEIRLLIHLGTRMVVLQDHTFSKRNLRTLLYVGILILSNRRGHPGLNWGPYDLQSYALPLSYAPCTLRTGLFFKNIRSICDNS